MCIRDRYMGHIQKIMADQIEFFRLTAEETETQLNVNRSKGLNTEQINKLREKYGRNELEKEEPPTLLERIIEQFKDVLVQILLISAIVSFLVSKLGDQHEDHEGIPPWVEPLVIFTILVANACVGIYQDYDAEKAIDSLKSLQSAKALVLRNSEWAQIDAAELVPGDIVRIHQGDMVPADVRLLTIETTTIKSNESTLTGEVNPVAKEIEAVTLQQATIQDKRNYLFSGSTISNGSAICAVIAIGMKTEIGKISKAISDVGDMDTPLKKRLDQFGKQLAYVIMVICILVFVINIPNFTDSAYSSPIQGAIYFFKIAVSLAVAAIPEGLSAVITTCLALGTRAMSKKNAIIRKLPSVETLGCCTVICSDKTGTLTTNQMCVKKFCLLKGENIEEFKSFDVEGVSYDTKGKITDFDSFIESNPDKCINLQNFIHCASLCNDAQLIFSEEKKAIYQVGLPTEAALKTMVEKIGAYDNKASKTGDDVEKYNNFIKNSFVKEATLEFTRDRKSMSVLCKKKNEKFNTMYIKGAPDYLLKKSIKIMTKSGDIKDFTTTSKKQLENQIHEYAKVGLRTLALTIKRECNELKDYNGHSHPSHKLLQNTDCYGQLEQDCILIGVAALQDPARPNVGKAIEKCKKAGISVIMITGDIKETAESISQEIGIIGKNEVAERSFTGLQFENMKDSEKREVIKRVIAHPSGLTFSRTEPRHKLELVKLIKDFNQVVAMTGDGVNDAPALAQADIGIAMGISGTEVAKEASDMILADDNFETIVTAVEMGRGIFNNMKAFINYMISSNIGEVVTIFLSTLLGIPDAFNSIQLLWVNLSTDGLPAMALSYNKIDPDIMQKPPRRHDEPIISGFTFIRYMILGSYVGIACVSIFIYWYMFYDWSGYNQPLVNFKQLSNWSECLDWKDFKLHSFLDVDLSKKPCNYFTVGKKKPCSLALSTLVFIEMFNSFNALSEESSILTIGLFSNPFLIIAVTISIVLHSCLIYLPFLQFIFGTTTLNFNDWVLVVSFAFPIILIDECLKILARYRTKKLIEKLKQD
eukprot:TRINITY_DN585_c0_g1_i3.p1 TRINITY_DN585_c0_g1~~TRINITY_DN585_c0_g1_i3.p1  ORF type:complete len:1064 (+),score=436.88 TRINITY_DN585_c0_g1_i3:64-3192(+)